MSYPTQEQAEAAIGWFILIAMGIIVTIALVAIGLAIAK